jgi:hypothetical protein
MRPVFLRAAVAFGLVLGSFGLTTAEEPKAPDWSGYVYISDVVGEVVKADDSKVTLRITWFGAQGNGGNNHRPNLSGNHRNFHNPHAPNGNRPQGQVKEQHHDYVLDYLPQSLVRMKKLPPKPEVDGKKVPYTQKEIDELRAPSSVTGYAASRSDLTPGTIVEVILVRDKTISNEKATEGDLRIKYAIIQGHDPNPPKDIGGSDKKDDKKKKN